MNAHEFDMAEEAALVRKARLGNEAAFETLYRRHAPAVYTLALRLTGEPTAAEDITQETFLRLLRFLGGLRSDRPVRPWLKTVTSNAAIDRLRIEARYRDDDGLLDTIVAADNSEAVRTMAIDSEKLLRRLPPLTRTVLWLHDAEGWSHVELGKRFGRSESWSKSIVSRARAFLRASAGQPESVDDPSVPNQNPAYSRR